MRIPIDIGVIYFIGIGGIGMSGIAEVLKRQGFKVAGSDMANSVNVQRLRRLGIDVKIGQHRKNIENASVVVVSTAIQPDNVELMAAREMGIPIVRRAEMLAELMRLKWSIAVAGTHGKTTTTSIIAHILDMADIDPMVINGGIINSYNTNIRLGDGDWFVAEADESDGSFLKLPATIAVVTNIDPEHMEHYGSFSHLKRAFASFVEKVPFYGFAVMCIDHRRVQNLIKNIADRRIITYGLNAQADIQGKNIRIDKDGTYFDIVMNDKNAPLRLIKDIFLSMHGMHNVSNALAAAAVAHGIGIEDNVICDALASFQGVKRRFTFVGEAMGIRVIDDYGHHPVEILAVLQAARDSISMAEEGRIIAVVQPHRYSRLEDLFDEFCTCMNDADYVLVADVYAAGEAPIDGVNKDALVEGLRRMGHKNVEGLKSPSELAKKVLKYGKPGDMVVCLGAGDISKWANDLPDKMRKIGQEK